MPGERVTIYDLDADALLGRALFGYDWTVTPLAGEPGTIVTPDVAAREPALPGVVVPLRPHFGTMGVAPFVHATAAGQTLYVTGQMPTGVDGVVVGSDVAT